MISGSLSENRSDSQRVKLFKVALIGPYLGLISSFFNVEGHNR